MKIYKVLYKVKCYLSLKCICMSILIFFIFVWVCLLFDYMQLYILFLYVCIFLCIWMYECWIKIYIYFEFIKAKTDRVYKTICSKNVQFIKTKQLHKKKQFSHFLFLFGIVALFKSFSICIETRLCSYIFFSFYSTKLKQFYCFCEFLWK